MRAVCSDLNHFPRQTIQNVHRTKPYEIGTQHFLVRKYFITRKRAL
jgi:hypothetical protein